MEQRSPEWFVTRLGKVTASRVSDVIAKTKTGWGAGRKNYAAQLICERLTGTVAPTFSNAAMQWGTDQEPFARQAYAFHIMEEVSEVGFVDHPTVAMSGCSPDGLIGDLGLVEIKCPNTATHLETLEADRFPGDYYAQIQWQLACTNRNWCDAVSFDPRLPGPLQLFVERIDRSGAYIAELEAAVRDFLTEIDERVTRLRELYEPELVAA